MRGIYISNNFENRIRIKKVINILQVGSQVGEVGEVGDQVGDGTMFSTFPNLSQNCGWCIRSALHMRFHISNNFGNRIRIAKVIKRLQVGGSGGSGEVGGTKVAVRSI